MVDVPEAASPSVDERWFSSGDEPHLIGARCTACGTYAFPPEIYSCPNPRCGAPDLERVPLSRRGRVWSFSINHYPAPPPTLTPEPFEPYAVAAVELTEEAMVVLGLVASGVSFESLRVGLEMELVVEQAIPGSDEIVWKWRPA